MTIKTTLINDLIFSFTNEYEFNKLYKEIFVYKVYKFTTDTISPFILDCGAHIGVSVLYFKMLYPHAKVIAFEPSPDTFKLLELNIRQNNLKDVDLVNAAISNNVGEIDFYVSKEASSSWHWSDAAVKNAWYSPEEFETIKVPAVKLSSYITQNVDLLKLDIEGMEEISLKEIEDKLYLVKEIKMEFHGDIYDKDILESILSILRKNKFKFINKSNIIKIILCALSRNKLKFVYNFSQSLDRGIRGHFLPIEGLPVVSKQASGESE